MDGIAINYMVFGMNYTDEMWVSGENLFRSYVIKKFGEV